MGCICRDSIQMVQDTVTWWFTMVTTVNLQVLLHTGNLFTSYATMNLLRITLHDISLLTWKNYILYLDLNSFNAYIQTCCCVDAPRYATPTMHHEAAEEPLHNQQLHYWSFSPTHDMLLGYMKDELHSRCP